MPNDSCPAVSGRMDAVVSVVMGRNTGMDNMLLLGCATPAGVSKAPIPKAPADTAHRTFFLFLLPRRPLLPGEEAVLLLALMDPVPGLV